MDPLHDLKMVSPDYNRFSLKIPFQCISIIEHYQLSSLFNLPFLQKHTFFQLETFITDKKFTDIELQISKMLLYSVLILLSLTYLNYCSGKSIDELIAGAVEDGQYKHCILIIIKNEQLGYHSTKPFGVPRWTVQETRMDRNVPGLVG